MQRSHLGLTQHDSRVAHQCGRLLTGQRQVGRADLGDPALGPQPRHPQRRLVPAGQHQPRAVRDVIGQHRQRGPALPVAQQVHVIEHQHHRHRHRRERRPQPGHHRTGHRTGGRGQRVEHRPAHRLHRIQRLRDVAEQHLRVVVCFVGRYPREGLAVVLGPLRQQRGLPVPGRRDHRDDRAGVPHQPSDQRRAADRARPQPGTAQLGRDQVEARSVVRPAGPDRRAPERRCRPCLSKPPRPTCCPPANPRLARPRQGQRSRRDRRYVTGRGLRHDARAGSVRTMASDQPGTITAAVPRILPSVRTGLLAADLPGSARRPAP